jgi:DNA-binding NtrC family response regulator
MYRLQVLTLEVPPLRERPGDPLLLAEHFLRQFARRYGVTRPRELDAYTCGWLDEYPWPGNIRELENLIHREFLLGESRELHISMPSPDSVPATHSLAFARPTNGSPQPYAAARKQVLEKFDTAYLHGLLQHTDGNVTHAARLAGKERRALGKMLKLHGIDCTQYRKR